MIHVIETIEQFVEIKDGLEPVYITSKTHGKVMVPCANTVLVKVELVMGNLYNPNHVPHDKMELLQTSILSNGFCFPIVCIYDEDLEKFVIIDGFHRKIISDPGWLDFDYVPLAILDKTIAERMLATMQFNKARGIHQVDLDADVIRLLIEQGMTDQEIAEKLSLEEDTVFRYKQLTGFAELFKNTPYSTSWSMVEVSDNDEDAA